jgi:riboflavin synthase
LLFCPFRGYFCPSFFSKKIFLLFTGIVESLGTIVGVEADGSNRCFRVASPISHELKVDQSLSHDGVCLTVTAVGPGEHTVTAIEETLGRTALGAWAVGRSVNLERAMPANGRLDGHFVQGHVDTVAECIEIEDRGGSWHFEFRAKPYPDWHEALLVDKGSVCVNGVSLTVVRPEADRFSLAIIPYTWEHTTFRQLRKGDPANIEFDVLGKYMLRYLRSLSPFRMPGS